MLDTLNTMHDEGLAQLASAGDADSLEAWRIKYLGAKGALKAAMPMLKDVLKDQKPAVGARLNEVKTALEADTVEMVGLSTLMRRSARPMDEPTRTASITTLRLRP